MAKRLLLNILVDFLGDYVEGLSEENLKLAVWSGKIVLKNLQLNRKTLQNWYLPISVAHGSVRDLEVTIPWASLDSNPVKVILDGVYLQIGPLDASSLDANELQKQAFISKIHRLEQIEKTFELSLHMLNEVDNISSSKESSNTKSMTYWQRLSETIIDNIEVTLQNIHIRYEDSRTIPGQIFSAGITLDSFVVTTTDENWRESFVARTSAQLHSAIHKLATTRNAGFYWNSNETCPLADLPFSQWESLMQSLIYTRAGHRDLPLGYILAPPNNMTVRFIHNKAVIDDITPRFNICVESTNLPLKLDQSQYTQLMSTANILAALERRKQLFLHRPTASALVQPAAWWKYALILVTKKGDILTKKSEVITLCMKSRARYINLIKQSRSSESIAATGTSVVPSGTGDLSAAEKEELIALEKALPLHALIVFRKLIILESVEEMRQQRKREKRRSEASWWGWGSRPSSQSDDEDVELDADVTLENLGKGLGFGNTRDANRDLISTGSYQIKFVLKSSAYLELFVNGLPFADIRMALTIEAEKRSSRMVAVLSLNNLVMTDTITKNPIIKNIITVRSSAYGKQSSEPMIKVVVEHQNGKFSVHITALPFELTWNKLCIQKILGMFLYYARHAGTITTLAQAQEQPLSKTNIAMDDKTAGSSSAATAARTYKHSSGGIDVIFEADAPKLIFPEDACIERGYVLLDTGYLAVKGNLSPSGMWWEVSLSAINAGMPRTVQDMYLFGQQSLYLIKPFNLKVSAQNIVKEVADMTCQIRVDPEVRGELDDSKLARLLGVVQIVSNTFVTALRGDDVLPAMSSVPANVASEPIPESGSAGLNTKQVASTTVGPTNTRNTANNNRPVLTEESPLRRFIDVTLYVPELALDLQYDMIRGYHLVLVITSLQEHLVLRPYDMKLLIDLNTLSIQDSQRCASQRDLARTPATGKKLVHVSYIFMYSKKSPYFKKDGAEVVVEFAEIVLNVDSNTLLHLRPFYEVILGRRDHLPNLENGTVIADNSNSNRSSSNNTTETTAKLSEALDHAKAVLSMTQNSAVNANNSLNSTAKATNPAPTPAPLAAPRTMHVMCTLGKISLEMLQTVSDGNRSALGVPKSKLPLDQMFCLEVAGLTADVYVAELIKADVRLRTVDVIDRRESSSEYVFKSVLTPDASASDAEANAKGSENHKKTDGDDCDVQPEVKGPQAPFLDDENLLTIQYTQESRQSTFIDIIVRNITSFVSLDAILDLINVSVANSFAVLDLVAPVSVTTSTSAYGYHGYEAVSSRGIILPSKVEQYMAPITISVRVRIPNSRLILLEDPTTKESRAVVGRCGIEVTYVREVKGGYTREIHEALHVSTTGTEVFVLMNMQHWNPMQILEPLGTEFHMTRMLEKGMVISIGCSLDTDAVDARVSLNDLKLAQSILLRRTLTTSDRVTVSPSEESGIISERNGIAVTVYDIMINVGPVYFIVINDFNGQNIPLLRLQLEGTMFSVDGVMQHLRGQGEVIYSMDFYNIGIASWEPVLERWHAEMSLDTLPDGRYIQVMSKHTMQLTISGIMLETLLQTYSQLSRPEDTQVLRDDAPDVTIRNQLGFPVEIYDSRTSTKLLTLMDDSLTLIRRSMPVEQSGGSGSTRVQIPLLMDLYLLGQIGEQRMPLYHLPLNVKTYKAYHLRPIAGDESNTNPMEAAAVIEEIYENQRYDPILSQWRPPFLLSDPYEWTNSSGDKLQMEDIELPSDEWDWQDEWTIDVPPEKNEEEKVEGWEYANSFALFSSSSQRRVLGSLDYVRRRRWIRGRVPKPPRIDDPYRPLTLFWDVTTKANGSRSVLIRSGFQIANCMPFPILVTLSNSSWDDDWTFGPIGPNALFGVPLLNAYATGIKIKPDIAHPDGKMKQNQDGDPSLSLVNDKNTSTGVTYYDWCRRLLCGLRTQDYKKTYDVTCNCNAQQEHGNSICVRMLFKQTNRSLLLTLIPYIIVQNRLPCEIMYKCTSTSSGDASHEHMKAEEGTLTPGASCKLIHTSLGWNPHISFRASIYNWSKPQPINFNRFGRIDMDLTLPNGHPGLVLSMRSKRGQGNTAEVCIFSRGVVIDNTGLDLLIRSSCASIGPTIQQVVRKTYSETDKSKPGVLNINMAEITNAYGNIDNSSTFSGDPANQPDLGNTPVTIGKLHLKSRRRYMIATVDVGDPVYTDRDLRWTNLPSSFRGQTYLSTPCEDRSLRVPNLIQFTVTRSAVVFILYDHRNSLQPPWLVPDGYRRISEQAVARRVAQGIVHEHSFIAWGKEFSVGQLVSLGCNGSKDCRSMFVVFIVPAHTQHRVAELLDLIPFDVNIKREAAQNSWLLGGNGLTMFYAADGNIAVGVNRGTAWCEQVHTQIISSSKGLFEAIDRRTGRGYQLAYSLSAMPGIFRRTQVVTFMPRYCIVNCMDEPIEIRQLGTQETLFIEPFHAEGWHKSDAMKGSMVQLRCQSSLWSLGSVDVNEVGSTVLLLPGADRSSYANHRLTVAHIEVKLAELTENCAVLAVIWRGAVDSGASLSIRNDSDVPVTVQQANVNYAGSRADALMFEISVPAGSCVPFGWTDPQAGTSIMVATGTSLAAAGKRVARMDILHVGSQLRLPDSVTRTSSGSQNEVLLAVQAAGGGRMLRIVRRPEDLNVGDTVRKRGSATTELSLIFSLASIGISLVVEKPIRREFLSLYAEGVGGRIVSRGPMKSYEFVLRDLQVDNYSETCIHPVLLHSCRQDTRRKQKDNVSIDTPLVQIAIIQDVPLGSSTIQYKYIAVRILEIELAVDSSTIQLLIADLISDLEFVSRDQVLASRVPERWVEEYNLKMLAYDEHRQLVDVYKAQIVSQASKMYFQELILHPLKITLTYAQTPFPRKKDTENLSVSAAVLEVITSMAGVDRMVIKLNSFIVSEAMESANSLTQRIASKTMRDLQYQLAQMAGSLTMIGSPVGLARNIGHGVEDFFYEPYQGLVQSPQEFVIGIGKGTSSLVAGVVTGALNSTLAIVGTASRGIALLSGDPDFVRSRALQQQRNKAAKRGALAGAQEGVASVYTGFASGISGLFTKPIEEAKRDGTVGFFRGVGLGVIGAAVKPVLGVTDGFTSVAQGISNQVGDDTNRLQARPPRAFDRSEADSNDLRLVPIDIAAAFAQEFVLKRAQERGYKDVFICRVPLTSTDLQAVILSEVYVYWRREAKLWGRSWADISHVLYSDEGVGIVMYGGRNKDITMISCGDKEHSILLYTALARNSHRMGNPANTIPVEVAVEMAAHKVEPSDESPGHHLKRQFSARISGPAGELDGYRFGMANKTRLAPTVYSEKDVLLRAEHRIKQGLVDWNQLDESVWQLLWEWDLGHRGLHASRCCATILINESNSPIQLTRTQVLEGRGLLVFVCQRYDPEARCIAPNGVLVIFGYAYSPSPLEVGHFKAMIYTPAFTATLSSRKRETKCEGQGGFSTGFLEKTLDRWWSKNVILIS